ncbi:pentapeptide repeat-containing protein [Tunturiibacter gelidiferens]|uniref:pentapeptide repeat-containing protein n=1 Tax=Tunturiibacter gelidiferens TaxID=3069689 RepID=UPI003D9B3167
MIIHDTNGNVLCDTSSDAFLDLRDLRNANFRGQQLEVLDLSDVDLRGADFTGADLYWTYLFRANCEGSIFRNCRLSGVVLDGANLRRADFTGAYISYDNVFHSSSLIEADLTDALLDRVDLKGSRYNRLTVFPHGFDPKANGTIEVDEEQGLVVPTGIKSDREE